tara:strand:- start:99 stop:338 length:240 start_codon:yes stop_codon:yes gene_type:complete
MESTLYLLARQDRLNNKNTYNIDDDLFYILKKKYKNKIVIDETIFKKINNKIEIILDNEIINQISKKLVNDIFNDILKE